MSWEIESKWRDEFVEQAHQLALLGATEKEMAMVFGVTDDCITKWKNKRPGFYDAICTGRLLALGKVAFAVHKSATGYDYEETVETTDKDGNLFSVVKYTKHRSPNALACKYILSARSREKWSEKTESIHTNINIAKIDLSQLPSDVLMAIESAQKKQLTENAGHN